MLQKLTVATLLSALTSAAAALSLDGMPVPDTVRLAPEGTELILRGGYVRTYFFRKTTSYALYTVDLAATYSQLTAGAGPKRMVITILMQRFTDEQFRSGWRDQFAAALSEDERRRLAPQIEQFMAGFETLVRGEQLSFDFIRGEGVRLSIRGKLKTTIAGDAFANALLSVWLGPNTVDAGLVRALLEG